MASEELMRLGASASRRVIGVGAMLLLGGLLIYVALATPPASILWQAFLLAIGGFALWFSTRLWESTGHELVLTETALTDTDGTVVAKLEDIARVDRSMFAMKPSNGFLIILKAPQPRVWRPGLWWRWGKRVAIGGVTSASASKPMADVIALKLKAPEDL